MRKPRLATLLLALVVSLVPCLLVQAESPAAARSWPGASTGSPQNVQDALPPILPCVTTDLGLQKIQVCIPGNFNGTLLVYAHGYVPPSAPIALPAELADPQWQSLAAQFLAMGYGFATTSYSTNGYAVQQAELDLLALVGFVKANLPPDAVQRVLLFGVSEGGLITTMMIEKHPDVFAGGLAMCGPVGGIAYQVDYLADFRVVFDYFFPDVLKPEFDVVNIPPTAFMNWGTYSEKIAAAIQGSPSKTRQLFDVRLVNATTVARDPANLATSSVQAAQELLWYNIWGGANAGATTAGQPYSNSDRWYWGSANDRKLNAGVARYTADSAARAYMQQFYQPTGALQRPLVMLHTTRDWVVPFQHEMIYFGRSLVSGGAGQLTVLPVDACGHCNFTAEQVQGGLGLLLLRTGAPVPPQLQSQMQTLPAPLQ